MFQDKQNKKNKPERFQRKKMPSEFDSKLLDLARVTRVTKGGKQLRFRAVIVLGNKKGKIGLAVSKGIDVQQAVEKATRLAKKNLIEVPISGSTIAHEVKAKFGPARVLLRPQGKGRGLVAGGQVRIICQLAGIKDISSKLLSRSRNKLNIAKATIQALEKLKIDENANSSIKTKEQTKKI
ncbi:30S ribosomal protein S5 [Candidatus Gribaldobacteria bacterium]|nr:30S ribosomal protein S5 [Candidatus Gribaldobacteria bacterium]